MSILQNDVGKSSSERDRRCEEIVRKNPGLAKKVDRLYELFRRRYGEDDSARKLFVRIVSRTKDKNDE